MSFLLSLIISISTISNPEPQVGYWICDAIRQEKNVDFVILPHTIFTDVTSDSLVLTYISLPELNQLLAKNLNLDNLIPISGFTILIDTLRSYEIKPDNIKEQYFLITTKSLFNSDKATRLSEGIIEIFISHLNKAKHLELYPTNRYVVGHFEQNEKSNKININTATKDELETLPGIGPKTAQKIIDYRKENGPFKSIEEIMNVKGIKQKKFNKIKDLITI